MTPITHCNEIFFFYTRNLICSKANRFEKAQVRWVFGVSNDKLYGVWTTDLEFKFLNQDKGSCDRSDFFHSSSKNFNMVSQTLELFELVDDKYFVNTYFVCLLS